MRRVYLIYIIFIFAIGQASGQCGCTNCPLGLPDNAVEDFFVNVFSDGTADCNLATNPLNFITLNFNHEYLGDLTITLTSPGGQTITLVGPEGFFGGTDVGDGNNDNGDVFNLTFTDGAATVFNNQVITGTLDDITPQTVTGTYQPFSGSLGGFTGNLCGTWVLNVNDGQGLDGGAFSDFQLGFGNTTGLI
jgi:hypothetical protein